MSSSPKNPNPMVGTLTVRIIRAADLEKKRLIGKMDPYVKLALGGAEKFKTKTADNQDRTPSFNQSFLFNLTGVETDLHLRVYDSEVLTDSYLGRADISLMTLLSGGGGEQVHDLADPVEFRRITGKIWVQASFVGTGGPAAAQEQAPIVGQFHFQSNATGFLVHAVNDALQLCIGGMNDQAHAFEFQGPYIRYVPTSQYITAGADGSLALKAGISDDAKFKWTGIGLQHVLSSKLLHPAGDVLAANTPLVLTSGVTAASGFSLVPCSGEASSSSSSARPPAVNPAAPLPNIAAMTIHSPQYPDLHQWKCAGCTFDNLPNAHVCAMCGAGHLATFDLDKPASTFPAKVHVTCHQHPMNKLPTIYKGTYNCDDCKLQGQGTVYNCAECSFDLHPACAHRLLKK